MEWIDIQNGDLALPEQINTVAHGVMNLEDDINAWVNYFVVGATGGVTINSGAANNVALTVQGAEGQTANLQEWKDNIGAIRGFMSPFGTLYLNGGLASTSGGGQYAYVFPSVNGTIISRNVANSNSALTVNQINPASTGYILDAQFTGTTKVKIDTAGHITSYASWLRIGSSSTPASATDTGSKGTICWDSNYLYVCIETDTWKRTPLTTW